MSDEQTPAHLFDEVLKQQLHNSSTYIADEGFSAALMQRLPRRRFRLGIMGWLAVSIGSLVGAFFAVPALLAPVFIWAAALNLASVVQIGLAMAAVTLVFAAGWMARQLDWF